MAVVRRATRSVAAARIRAQYVLSSSRQPVVPNRQYFSGGSDFKAPVA